MCNKKKNADGVWMVTLMINSITSIKFGMKRGKISNLKEIMKYWEIFNILNVILLYTYEHFNSFYVWP